MSTNTKYKWFALIVLVIGTFMAILDSSIVNIAIPKLMAVFGASTDQIEWVLTGYMLTMGVVIPLTGYLGDRFGLKNVYIYSLAMFTLGSALCGFAWDTSSLIAARVIQALGGGMLMPVSMTLIFNIFPREQIGAALGVWGISAMAAPAIGPTLSGYIVEHLDWRILFTINIPIGVLGVVLSFLLLDTYKNKQVSRFDAVGSITVIIGLFSLLLGLNKGNSEGWTSMYILSLFTISFISLTIFVINELLVPEPLLDLRILKNFSFSLSQLITLVTTIALFGGVFFLPLYLQNIKGLTAMQTGMLMFPSALATAIIMPIGGKLYDKFGARPLAILGISILIITTYFLSFLKLDTDNNTIMILMMLRGIGMGLAMMPVQTAGVAEIPTEKMGNASALASAFRQIAGSFGIAMLTSIMTSRQTFHLSHYTNSVNLQSPEGQNLSLLFSNIGVSEGFSMFQTKAITSKFIMQNIYQQAFIASINDAFLVTCGICIVGLLLSFLIKKKSPLPQNAETEGVKLENLSYKV